MDISVSNLTKTYGPQKAVDDISFTVKTGEVLGFLGPNGAGKTTTMKAITACMVPTAGKISIGGLDVFEQTDEVKNHIGYLPEHNPLYRDMYVIDYLRFIAEMHNIPKNLVEVRILEMIHVCGIQSEKHKKIQELSKGYRQRVGLAQALIHNPDVLILDEPTTGLDPNQIIEIRELIKRIGKAKTVILSSHILAEVEATCDRIMIINKGKLVADGTAEELRMRSRGNDLLRLKIEDADADEIFKTLQDLSGVKMVDKKDGRFFLQAEPGKTLERDVFRLCGDKSWVITEMTPVETKLEDVFRELTMN
ncbi:MAG: ATP-binding cassette domain-containing protein [Bacteroidales bacterium]